MYAVPGTLMGIVVMSLGFSAVKIGMYAVMRVPMIDGVNWEAIILAIALGIGLPVISNAGPIRKAIGTSLRDALDVNRKKKVDDITIKLT